MIARIKSAPEHRPRSARWRANVVAGAVTVGALVALAACGSDGGGGPTNAESGGATSSTASSESDETSANGGPVQLDVDPCTLLTIPEMEVAIGPGIEQGGFGEDLPGKCTYSVRGDVGAGVVGITLADPLVCTALRRAIDTGDLGSAVMVDVGDGGVVEPEGGIIQFLIGGGCVGIGGSAEGESLDQDTLVTLAMAAAGRIG